MPLNDIIPQEQISKHEWVYWQWFDVTTYGSDHVMMLRGGRRPISDSLRAAEEWDTWSESRRIILSEPT